MEVREWKTPFSKGDLHIVDLSWNGGHLSVDYAEGNRYELVGSKRHSIYSLIISLFHVETESIYDLKFRNVGVFRLLDESGLLELWKENEVSLNSLLIKGHAWSKESPLTFLMGYEEGWSHLVATQDDCVEIVSDEHPEIELVEKINRL